MLGWRYDRRLVLFPLLALIPTLLRTARWTRIRSALIGLKMRHKTEDLDRAIGSKSLSEFIKLSWPYVEPDQPFINSWHVSLLCEHYEACLRGEIRRLVVNIPPGMSKSRITCVFFQTWAWIRNPGLRFLNASFDSGLTMRDAGAALDLMQSSWFQARWGDRFMLPKVPPVGDICNNVGGWRFATSVHSKAFGRHADIQIIDDPIKPSELSKTALDASNEWLKNTMASRWRKPGLECRILIMQRLHVDDMAAHMIGEGATHLCLPMSYNPTIRCETSWGVDPRTEPGELLCPSRFDADTVQTLRKEMGGMVAAAQLDQMPVPEGGAIFKADWLKQLWVVRPDKFDQLLQSWDCSFKGLDTSDYVVGQVWGRKGGEYWLLDQVRGKWSFTETLEEVRKLSRKWPKVIKKLVEDKANGSAVVDSLRKELSGLEEVNPEGGKEARANAVSPLFEAANVWLPDPNNHPWVDDFVTEMCTFPVSKHDDQVDACTQALQYMHQRKNSLREAMAKLRSNPNILG